MRSVNSHIAQTTRRHDSILREGNSCEQGFPRRDAPSHVCFRQVRHRAIRCNGRRARLRHQIVDGLGRDFRYRERPILWPSNKRFVLAHKTPHRLPTYWPIPSSAITHSIHAFVSVPPHPHQITGNDDDGASALMPPLPPRRSSRKRAQDPATLRLDLSVFG